MKKLLLSVILISPLGTTMPAQACEGHLYAGIGLGKAGRWLNPTPKEQDQWNDDGRTHAIARLGYRAPIVSDWLWVSAEYDHHSTIDKVPPEPELDSFTIQLEARLY